MRSSITPSVLYYTNVSVSDQAILENKTDAKKTFYIKNDYILAYLRNLQKFRNLT